MAKFHGAIGYVHTETTAPGVQEEVITERNYCGDTIRNTRRLEGGDGLNDNLVINNQISVLGDDFAYGNFSTIRYVTWMGSKWKVTNIEVQRPRLLLTIGGVYNAP
jgi:hypothetical protein